MFANAGGRATLQHGIADSFTDERSTDSCEEEILNTSTPRMLYVTAEAFRRVFSFIEYTFTDALNYVSAPGPYCGAEERWRNVVLTVSASV